MSEQRYSVSFGLLADAANHTSQGGVNALGVTDVVAVRELPGPLPRRLVYAFRLRVRPGEPGVVRLTLGFYTPSGASLYEAQHEYPHEEQDNAPNVVFVDNFVPLPDLTFSEEGDHLIRIAEDGSGTTLFESRVFILRGDVSEASRRDG